MVDPNKTIGQIGQLRGAMQPTRRQFVGLGLVAPLAGFGGQAPRNRRRHHKDTRLYHGPLRLPQEVMDKAKESQVYRTTSRKLAVRILHEDIVYLLRVVCGRDYIGEVVRTDSGTYRVHVWSAITTQGRDLNEIA